MGSENQPGLSESEREVLRVLWDRGPGTVREINAELTRRGRRWAYTTVATLLQRLSVKEYAASDPSMIQHIFRAAVTRDEILERRLKDAADELCDGRAAPLVLALVQRGRFSADELARMRSLLDEASAGGLPGPPKSKAKPRPKSNT
jgi:BlaI family transcriptional regulator, penicillinase repressor